MAAGAAGTVGGLYFVITQDLGHGPGHDEDHHAEAHETHGKNEGQDDEGQDNEGDKEKSQGGPKDEAKSKTKSAPAEERNTEQPENPDKPGAGKPDKKKSDDSSADAPKNDESGEASPDKSDKVCIQQAMLGTLNIDQYRPTLAASPRAPTRPLASRRDSPIPTHTTARKSPSRTTRARRVRALLRPQSSRAPSQPIDPVRRTRRSAARLSKTRTHKAKHSPLSAVTVYPVIYSIPATTSIPLCCVHCANLIYCGNHVALVPRLMKYGRYAELTIVSQASRRTRLVNMFTRNNVRAIAESGMCMFASQGEI